MPSNPGADNRPSDTRDASSRIASFLPPPIHPPAALAYGLSVLSIIIATVGRLWLDPVLGDQLPYATYFLAVMFAAWHGGIGPALLSIVLGSLLANYLFLSPRYSFAIAGVANQLGMAAYFVVAFITAALSISMRTARQRAEANAIEATRAQESLEREVAQRTQAEESLRRLTEALEARGKERTAALSAANEHLLQEVAERKRGEAALRLRTTALESAANGVVITDRDGTILWVNAAVTALTGYAAEDLIGQTPRLLKSGEHDEAFYRDLWSTITSGQVWRREIVNRRKDGCLYHEDMTITPVRDVHGTISHFIAIKQDVTDRKQAEHEMEKQLRRTAAYLQTAGDGLHVVDTEGQVLEANPAFCEMLGYSAEEMRTMTLGDFDVQWSREELTGKIHDLMVQRSALFETLHRCKDGRLRRVEIRANVVTLDGQDLIFASARDITERTQVRAIEALLHEIDRRVLEGQTPEEFLRFLCARLLDLFSATLVWIGMKEPDGSISLKASAGADGLTAEQFLRSLHLGWREGPEGRSCVGDAIRLGRPHQCIVGESPESPWMARAQQYRLKTLLAIPLRTQTETHGALNLYARTRDAFDTETVQRLELIAGRISVALMMAQAQQQLRLQGAAMATAANAIFITDRAGRIQWVNEAFTRMSGFTETEARGQTPRLLKSGRQDLRFYRELWNTILTGRPWRGEVVDRHKDGRLYTVEQTITPLRDARGEVSHFVAIHEDITVKKEAEARILHMAQHDALTDLPNRMLLRDRLSQTLARAKRNGRLVALLFLDLDRFKLINDTLGHDVGDRLLKGVADRLRRCIRESDTVARLGGDEFTVVLADLQDAKGAVRVAENILAALSEPFNLEGREVYTAASIGVVLYPTDADDADGLITHADTAMYRAKQQGGNCYQFFTAAMQAQVRARLETEHTLRDALARREFVLQYQPVVDLATGSVTGFEALVRWRSPSAGLVPPVEFIPIAEETGLIIPLGDWILQEACTRAKAWQQAGFPSLRMAVNLSARQFRQPRLADKIAGTLKETGLEARDLELEITESVFLEDAEATLETLTALKDLGVRLAIDNFGTGFSSISYLKRFSIDRLKIDQSFVGGLGTDPDDEAIVTAILAMARTLKLAVVAEGVQEESHRTFLLSQGCPEAQGFLFSRPLPPEEVPAFLKGRAMRQ